MSHYDKAKEVLVKDLDALMQNRNKTAHDYLLYSVSTGLFNLVEALEADLQQVKADLGRIEDILQHRR
jgi:hypothetical protein